VSLSVYIALLRGVNVGGHNKIAMADLKTLFSELGFQEVITYIQSGNVVFKSDLKDPLLIENTLKQKIREKFSLNVEVIVKSREDLSKIIKVSSFNQNNLVGGEKIYLTFFAKKPSADLVEKLRKVEGKGDEILVKENAAYVLCRKGYSETVFNNNFVEKMLGVLATSRNLQTSQKLAEIATNLSES
jgi:uncharacterized protein (DUF1697 family)